MYDGDIYIEILTDELKLALNLNFYFIWNICYKLALFSELLLIFECFEGCCQK